MDKAQVIRHEKTHRDPKEIIRAAVFAIVESCLPLDLLERDGFKRLFALLNEAYSDGFSRHIIKTNMW